MRDEDAAEQLTNDRYHDALKNLSESCQDQPIGSPDVLDTTTEHR
jgi:hypothetical protein